MIELNEILKLDNSYEIIKNIDINDIKYSLVTTLPELNNYLDNSNYPIKYAPLEIKEALNFYRKLDYYDFYMQARVKVILERFCVDNYSLEYLKENFV